MQKRQSYLLLLGGLLVFILAPLGDAAAQPALAFPLACTLGDGCFLQSYADRQAGEGYRDYRCGRASYNGHRGTDIRLKTFADIEQGVPVLAAAPGTVLGLRDGLADREQREDPVATFPEGQECGNGVLIEHAQGWETQYCHLKRGSVTVTRGQQVDAGTPLGAVGASGLAQFPHLHFVVRRDGQTIDPFDGQPLTTACRAGASDAEPLWDAAAQARLGAYQPTRLLHVGLTDAPVVLAGLEAELPALPAADPDALIVYVWAVNVEAQDRFAFSIEGPAGALIDSITDPLDRSKAQYVSFSGRRRPQAGWVAGTYQVTAALMRGEETVFRRTLSIELPGSPDLP